MTDQWIVCGIGNPILSDDSLGVHTVLAAEEALGPMFPKVDFKVFHAATLDVWFEIMAYQRVILIDSVQTGERPIGFCHEISLPDLTNCPACTVNLHSLSLPQAHALAQQLGFHRPETLVIYGIEGKEFTQFSELPGCPLPQSILPVVEKIKRQLEQWQPAGREKQESPCLRKKH